MLLALGVGVVTVAETRIDSSVAAMIAGSVPLQVIVWRTIARERVSDGDEARALVGLVGLALVSSRAGSTGARQRVGLAMMLGATIAWSTGSFISGRLRAPA